MSTNNTFKAVECASCSETGCATETQFGYSRLSNTPVVVRAVEGQASESSLDIKAALILCACVRSCHTFINIWVQKTKRDLKMFLKNRHKSATAMCNVKVRTVYPGSFVRWAPRCIHWLDRNSGSCQVCCDSDRNKCDLQWAGHTHLCLKMSQGQMRKSQTRECHSTWNLSNAEKLSLEYTEERWILFWKMCPLQVIFKLFNFTFTSHAIYVTELVATATVTLVWTIHVGALLTARIALTLVQICTETTWLQTNMNCELWEVHHSGQRFLSPASLTCFYTSTRIIVKMLSDLIRPSIGLPKSASGSLLPVTFKSPQTHL